MKKKTLIILTAVLSVIVVLLGGLFGAFLAVRRSGRLRLEQRRRDEQTRETAYADYTYDPSVIRYGGEKYKYNEDLSNILFLGIDKDDALGKDDTAVGGAGQCDVILLVALNEKNRTADIIAIDRNTVLPIESYDAEGNYIGVINSQIALSYAYGDGRETSCKMAAEAVSDLLFEVPIHAYYSMTTAAVRDINDMLGGVKVTIPVDMTATDENFTEGAEVRLDGEQAEKFLRARMELEDGSNAARLERQKIYLSSLISTAKSAMLSDLSLPSKLYEKVMNESCTDIGLDEAVYLASLLSGLEIRFHGIAGITVKTDSFDEFYPDSAKLYEKVLEIFYNKID